MPLALDGKVAVVTAAAQRIGKPEDIGELAAFLASGAAGYIHEQIVTVDGGVSARFPHDVEMCEIMEQI